MDVNRSPSSNFADTDFFALKAVQEGRDKVLAAIAQALGARPMGGGMALGGNGLISGLDGGAAGGEQAELTVSIADIDIRTLSFSDAATLLSMAPDPAPTSQHHNRHDTALLGATLAAQTSLAEHQHSGETADHLGVLADYYAQHA